MDGPIFLAGIDRSGIGLLGEVLEMHPDVSMTRRSNFWRYYDGRFGDLSTVANVDRALDEMMRNARMRVLEPDRDRLRADLARRRPTYPLLFELMQRQLMERRGCSRWGDKSLGSERFAPTIMSAYPTAQMVHVLRDPRDRYASHKHHRGLSRGGLGAGAVMWRWSERLALAHSQRFGARYHVVRYEDLVEDTESTLETIRTFLELDSESISATDRIAPRPLDTRSIGRFREDISTEECRFIQLTTRRGMNRRGYLHDAVVLSPGAQLRFWGRYFPVQAVRAGLWRPMTELGHRRGRQPSERRLI